MVRARFTGIEVNKDLSSKETIISSLVTDCWRICCANSEVFLTENLFLRRQMYLKVYSRFHVVPDLSAKSSSMDDSIAVIEVPSGLRYKWGKRVILHCFNQYVDPFALFAHLLNTRIYYPRFNCNNSYCLHMVGVCFLHWGHSEAWWLHGQANQVAMRKASHWWELCETIMYKN